MMFRVAYSSFVLDEEKCEVLLRAQKIASGVLCGAEVILVDGKVINVTFDDYFHSAGWRNLGTRSAGNVDIATGTAGLSATITTGFANKIRIGTLDFTYSSTDTSGANPFPIYSGTLPNGQNTTDLNKTLEQVTPDNNPDLGLWYVAACMDG